jgi:Barrel-sandwich domain of CusB or HlyD membrane-fusion
MNARLQAMQDEQLLALDAPAQAMALLAQQQAQLTGILETWRASLLATGLACRATAWHGSAPGHCVNFADMDAKLQLAWEQARAQCKPDQPVLVSRLGPDAGADSLIALRLELINGEHAVVGVLLAPPHGERSVPMLLLAAAWLQVAVTAASSKHNHHAARLLEILGHIGSHRDERTAAQDWICRTASWMAEQSPLASSNLNLSLFEVRGKQPVWWVSSNTAWIEPGSPVLQAATELATRAMIEQQEVRTVSAIALPLLDQGEVSSVLVINRDTKLDNSSNPDELPLHLARASAAVAEPMLRHWRNANRSLLRHGWDTLRTAWHKTLGPGHLLWKVSAGATVIALMVLLLVPVPDRITANTVIEGQQRRMVTAPFDGFLAQSWVRPGERVEKGQKLAKLDDRESILEQARFESERDQATGKLRQATSDHDAAAMVLATAELRQAEAQLALVQTRLERSTLTAPITGLVAAGDWAHQIGSRIETGRDMFEIDSTDSFRVILHVPDRDIAKVRKGQNGSLRLTGQPNVAFPFVVNAVTAMAEVHDGVNGFRVEAAWQGQVPALSPGMQGIGKIEVGQANLLTIWSRESINWLRMKLWAWGW